MYSLQYKEFVVAFIVIIISPVVSTGDGMLYEKVVEEAFVLDEEISNIYVIEKAAETQFPYGNIKNTVVSFWNYERYGGSWKN